MTDIFRARPTEDDTSLDISELARNAYDGVRRNLWLIALTVLVFTGATVVYVLSRDDVYTARASLLIDPRIAGGAGGVQPAPTLLLADALVVDSEIEILRSDRLLYRVVEQLPEPRVEEGDGDAAPSALARLRARLLPVDLVEPPTEAQRLEDLVRWVRSKLAIEREGATYIITMRFRAQNSELAAFVVNTLAREYLVLQSDEQVDRAAQATRQLRAEISRLSDAIAEREAEAQAYRIANDIPRSETNNTVTQQIADIDSRTINARSIIREGRSQLQSIALDIKRLDAPLEIGSLASLSLEDWGMGQFQDQLRRLQEQNAAGGWNDDLARILERVVEQFRSELIRLRDTREARIAVAEANLAALAEERETLEREADRLGTVRIPLDALEREINSLRNQYTVVSNRLRESEGADRFTPSIARIVDLAVPPERPSVSGGLLTVIAGALGGAILGLGLVFLREQLDDRLRAPRDVTDALGLTYGGAVPMLRTRDLPLPPAIGDRLNMADHSRLDRQQLVRLLSGTYSGSRRLGETLRRAATLMTDPVDGQVYSVLITSPRQGDGKTTFATNLAVFLSDRGKDVLLVDGDPHTGTLSRLFGEAAEEDIEETWGDVALIRRLSPRLRLLQAIPIDHYWQLDPSHYVRAVRSLLEEASGPDELTVIDAGTLTTTVEDLLSLPQIVKVFVVVRFGRVSTSALRSVLRQRPIVARAIAGVFLSQVQDRKMKRYDVLPD
ncbi:Uncharacterized protein involved in exopolysaccharide biosynthesis [Jannaschia faecimaris]|uniref:Uncharacterized protein involved in exopolysaccharide biosynthesis n=1 Tax=Jannaschia faecimaris TaxID=1244108 RepID=A0A1H3TVF2_9RHOB|nr:Wzz/FepE/Etk N-terminal domain-containing protein [Jannaschia faecimaris]SDZ54213.1 Uncharacterized protein involved in exopolysaccharide biosynthesis [Jannaschia faecimaris]